MCIRDSFNTGLTAAGFDAQAAASFNVAIAGADLAKLNTFIGGVTNLNPVSYTHLRAHETVLDLVCRLLLEKKTSDITHTSYRYIIPTITQ